MGIKGKTAIDNARAIEQIQQEINLLRKKGKVAGGETPVGTGIADKINISSTQELRNALDTSAADPTRQARIEELKKQVQAGNYELPKSPEQIQKMLVNINEEVKDLQDLISE